MCVYFSALIAFSKHVSALVLRFGEAYELVDFDSVKIAFGLDRLPDFTTRQR